MDMLDYFQFVFFFVFIATAIAGNNFFLAQGEKRGGGRMFPSGCVLLNSQGGCSKVQVKILSLIHI